MIIKPQQPDMGSPRRAPQAPDVIRRFKVAEGDPSRLLDFLIANLPELKRTRIKQMLRHDQVALDGVQQRWRKACLPPMRSVRKVRLHR